MYIDYPRAPHMVTLTIKGKEIERPRIGFAQFVALGTLLDFGRQEPPKGVITATGQNRKHIYNDLLPYGWVTIKKPKGKDGGAVEYLITKLGREIYETAQIAGGQKETRKALRLLDRQRAIAREAGVKVTGNGRRSVAA